MKILSIILFSFFVLSCATIPTPTCPSCPNCPPEDAIIMYYDQDGNPQPVKIIEGMLVPENYWTVPEWDYLREKTMREYYDRLQPKQEM